MTTVAPTTKPAGEVVVGHPEVVDRTGGAFELPCGAGDSAAVMARRHRHDSVLARRVGWLKDGRVHQGNPGFIRIVAPEVVTQ
jgi:hypothetical protein